MAKQPTSLRRRAAPTLAAALCLGVFLSAGIWQLERATQKRELLAAFDAGEPSGALRDSVADAQARSLRYRWAEVEGRYDAGHQVLLDNIVLDGQVGYHVLTPLRSAGGTVLVNRGWVPAPADREQLPEVGVSESARVVRGRIDLLPRPAIELAAPAPGPGAPWPRRLLYPRAETISEQLGYRVADYQLLLDPASPDGYVRRWRPGGMGPEKHVGYAVQWFGLSAAVIAVYLTLLLRSRRQP